MNLKKGEIYYSDKHCCSLRYHSDDEDEIMYYSLYEYNNDLISFDNFGGNFWWLDSSDIQVLCNSLREAPPLIKMRHIQNEIKYLNLNRINQSRVIKKQEIINFHRKYKLQKLNQI